VADEDRPADPPPPEQDAGRHRQQRRRAQRDQEAEHDRGRLVAQLQRVVAGRDRDRSERPERGEHRHPLPVEVSAPAGVVALAEDDHAGRGHRHGQRHLIRPVVGDGDALGGGVVGRLQRGPLDVLLEQDLGRRVDAAGIEQLVDPVVGDPLGVVDDPGPRQRVEILDDPTSASA
jgi:hypothetical protein